MTPHPTKHTIRQTYLAKRKTLLNDDITLASQQIMTHIKSIAHYKTAQHIAWFYPVKGEVNLTSLWQEALTDQKYCYLPAIQSDKTLVFLPFTLQTPTIANRYGIAEPNIPVTQAIPLKVLDLIFVPIVAFDPALHRLGMGAGYYDKTLSQPSKARLIGVAYDWQKKASLPKDPWDIALDMIITDKDIYTAS